MASCSGLPTFTPDLSRRGANSAHKITALQLVGPHGALSPVQSAAILNRLKAKGAQTSIFDRHLALEEAIVGSPLTVGNQVLLLQDGPATYKAMHTAILAAKDHINMETYILDDDAIGQALAQALIDKQLAGVQVNLIHDSVGTLNTPSAFFERLKNAGVHVLEYNPINPLLAKKEWTLNQRDHRKLLIVDGQIAFLGGINISSVYSGGSFGKILGSKKNDQITWRDTDLQLQGPVVAEFQKLFISTWERQNGTPLTNKDYFPKLVIAGQQVVRAIGSSPDDPYSLIYATLLSAISNAQTSIHITNAYFAPDPQLLTALEAAAERGVDVILILPSATDNSLVFHAGRSYYARLLRKGVKIYERKGVILHSKTALIDGVWATVGSTNMDWRSFLHNQELNAVVVGVEFGRQVQSMFDKDLAASEPISLKRWERRGLNLHMKEWFSSLWEYWL
jgi:cardiolipin synthase A/B